jgi:hypothetical protein
MQRFISPRPLGAVMAVLLFCASAITSAEAQRTGHTRTSHHDLTTPANFLYFGDPGTVRSFTCPVASGVRYTASNIRLALENGDLRIADGSEQGLRAPPQIQRTLAGVLNGPAQNGVANQSIRVGAGSTGRPSEEALIGMLTPASNSHPEARAAARELVRQLDGLVFWADRLNPARPGQRDYKLANQVVDVIGAYNRFVTVSSPEYLREDPMELMAIQTVLNQLVIAGLEYEGQTRVCMPGWTPRPPPPVVERPIQICLTLDDELREIIAIFVPSTGDTLVVVDGERMPLSQAFTETTALAGERPWFHADEVITFRNRNYERFGVQRTGSDAWLVRVGEWRGVSLFAPRAEANATPKVLYVPVARGCMVQPYQPKEPARG